MGERLGALSGWLKKMVLWKTSRKAALMRSVRERSSTILLLLVLDSSSLSAISFSRSVFGIRPKRTAVQGASGQRGRVRQNGAQNVRTVQIGSLSLGLSVCLSVREKGEWSEGERKRKKEEESERVGGGRKREREKERERDRDRDRDRDRETDRQTDRQTERQSKL